MDVFEELKKDHQHVRELFAKIEGLSQGARKTREDLFRKLSDELLRHAKAEEKAFYPKLENERQVHDLIEEAYKEHDHVEKMLDRIRTMLVDGDGWLDAIKKLEAAVEHHVREEEEELFPKARKILKDKADEIGEEVKQAKMH